MLIENDSVSFREPKGQVKGKSVTGKSPATIVGKLKNGASEEGKSKIRA
jgi:hypothetical protein